MPTYEPLHQYRYLSWQRGTKLYWAAASDHLHQSSDKGEYIATDSCFTLTQLHSVVYWWLTLDDWLLLYASQVKHLWFQQKQKREATVIATVALSWDQMLAVKTEEAKWLKDNHWMSRLAGGTKLYWAATMQWSPPSNASITMTIEEELSLVWASTKYYIYNLT